MQADHRVTIKGHHATDSAGAKTGLLPEGVDEILPAFLPDRLRQTLDQLGRDPPQIPVLQPTLDRRERISHRQVVGLLVDSALLQSIVK